MLKFRTVVRAGTLHRAVIARFPPAREWQYDSWAARGREWR